MHKNTTKCNKTLSKWCKNKHGASKIIDMFETYHAQLYQKLLKNLGLKLKYPSMIACIDANTHMPNPHNLEYSLS
jgi:benzoyl-CoA reductase/2-hydroxyglutaryl-CoA dehydratase subunit BcrC/BadD/HgdB